MNTLWVRLTVAFTSATLVSIVTVALVTNSQVSADFRRFYMHSQVQQSGLVERLGEYYGNTGSWNGVEAVLAGTGQGTGTGQGAGRGAGQGMGQGQGQGQGQGMGMMYGAPGYTLLDAGRSVVYSTTGTGTGNAAHISQADLDDALPIAWQGQTVGYLALDSPGRDDMGMSAPAQLFLTQVNTSLWQAALFAVALALVLGLLMARGLSAPLDRLSTAARRIARGDLDQRVSAAGPIGGTREVAGLALAFNDMAQNLRQAEQLRRNMVADIAHELRTPLTVLQGNLQAILDGVYPLDKNEIAAIHEETLILSRLVGDLHELSQAEAGQLKLDMQPTDIAPLVESVVAMFREAAADKQIALEIDVPGHNERMESRLFAVADADRTRQIVHNLLANALQHTPPGGRIVVRVARGDVSRVDVPQKVGPSLDTLDSADAIKVSVLDTGVGMSAEELPHVFDRFWRADRSRSRERGGSGLGLAIARYLVEGQGGQIGAESEIGKGSCFWFSLPSVKSVTLVTGS